MSKLRAWSDPLVAGDASVLHQFSVGPEAGAAERRRHCETRGGEERQAGVPKPAAAVLSLA